MPPAVARRVAAQKAARRVATLLEEIATLPREEKLQRLHEERDAAVATAQIQALESARVIFGQGDDVSLNLDDPSRDDGEVWDEVGIYPRVGAHPTRRTEQDLDRARAVCRNLAAENGYAKGAHENRVNYIAGEGFKWRAVPRDEATDDAGKKAQEAQSKAIQVEIDRFNEKELVPLIEQESVKRGDRDGEAFIRMFWGEGDEATLRVRFVEPEDVRTPQGMETAPGVGFGVRSLPNDVRTVLAYFVAMGDGFAEVDAHEVVHIKLNVDLNARRGWPTLWPVRRNFARAEKLLRNMSYVSAIQAAIALIVEHETATESQVESFLSNLSDAEIVNNATGRSTFAKGIQPGLRIDAPAGSTYKAPISSVNLGEKVEVLQADLREAAAALNWPEYMLTSDASNANFASTQVAESPAVRSTARAQQFFILHHRVIQWRNVENAIRAGRLPPSVRDDYILQAEPPSNVVRDKLGESQSNAIEHEHGVLSTKTWRSERGLDDAVEEQNLRAERMRSNAGGLGVGPEGDPIEVDPDALPEPGAMGPDGKPLPLPAPAPALGAPAGAAPAAAGVAKVQDTALNGAQVAELRQTLLDVSGELMSPEAAEAMILASFPFLTPEAIAKMVTAAKGFKPKEEPPPVVAPPFGGGKPGGFPPKGPTKPPGTPVLEGEGLQESGPTTLLYQERPMPPAPIIVVQGRPSSEDDYFDFQQSGGANTTLLSTDGKPAPARRKAGFSPSMMGELRALMRDVAAGGISAEGALHFLMLMYPDVEEAKVKAMLDEVKPKLAQTPMNVPLANTAAQTPGLGDVTP